MNKANIKNQITAILPVLSTGLMTGWGIGNILLGFFCVPMIGFILEYIYDMIVEGYNYDKNLCSLTIHSHVGEKMHSQNIPEYDAVILTIENILKYKKLVIEKGSWQINGLDSISIISVDKRELINSEFIWENELDKSKSKILVTHAPTPDTITSSKVINSVILKSDSTEILKNFLAYAKMNYININSKKISKFHDYTDRGWQSSTIVTVKTMETLFMRTDKKNILIDDLKKYTKMEPTLKRMGIPIKRGYLFHGAPGCGKSSAVYAIANYFDRSIYSINLQGLKKTDFKTMIRGIPNRSVVVFNDVDTSSAVCPRVSKVENDSKIQHSVLPDQAVDLDLGTVLDVLDGYNHLRDCIIIMTTNFPENLDSALKRHGRIDLEIEFETCNYQQLVDICYATFGVELTRLDLEKYIDKELFDSKNYSVAEILNSWILPNFDCWEVVLEKIKTIK